MITRLSYDSLKELESNEDFKKVEQIIDSKENKDTLKHNDDWSLFFKNISKEDVEKIIGTKIEGNGESLSEYISYFDGGEYMRVGYMEITIGQCIEEVQENIEKYEDRIWNAKDMDKEISQILKEQIKSIIDKKMKEDINDIDRFLKGETNWK